MPLMNEEEEEEEGALVSFHDCERSGRRRGGKGGRAVCLLSRIEGRVMGKK